MNFYESEEEWNVFFNNFAEVTIKLLELDPFGNDQELKKECEEVLALLNKKDISQSKRYYNLIGKLFMFFVDSKMSPLPELP